MSEQASWAGVNLLFYYIKVTSVPNHHYQRQRVSDNSAEEMGTALVLLVAEQHHRRQFPDVFLAIWHARYSTGKSVVMRSY
jgi:hypothetical protein